LLGGRVQLASEEVFHRLPGSEREGLQPLKVAGVVRWLRAPVATLLDEAELELGENSIYLGDLQIRRVADNFSPSVHNAC
jgi:hypothetical protein